MIDEPILRELLALHHARHERQIVDQRPLFLTR